MTEEHAQRRLAAILAADVAGYSRLMEADEASTLAALKSHRAELIDPKAAKYNGRTIKLMGDAVLMELPLSNLPGLASRRQHSGIAQRRIPSHMP